jgi:KUP system potassium uptake protein
MGHFGRRPIRLAWFALVMPSLLLNYFGQGALLLTDPAAVESPFYLLAPPWGLYPLVVLSTLATVIASQAVISGVFSLTRQAIQLGYTPRVGVVHTSAREIGQVYIPAANAALLVGVVVLVLGFQSSSNLASAYGVAVAATMVSTTLLASVVARRRWRWGLWAVGLVFLPLVLIDAAFLSANASKFVEGGWFPMLVGAVIFTLMTTWQRGREILGQRLREASMPLPQLIERLKEGSVFRVPGTAVFLTSHSEGVPHTLLHNLKHNKVLHRRVILLTVLNEDVPRIAPEERVSAEALGDDFYRVTARFGFMEDANVPKALEMCKGACGMKPEVADTTFFLGRETLIPTPRPGMSIWREKLFVAMSRNASRAMDFFRIPTDRVIELGTQVEL